MAKYIPLDAVLAEIERLRKIQPTNEFQPKKQNKIDWLAGKEFAIITLQVFLDTLEVKEADLEKEQDKEWNKCEPIDEGMGLEIASIEHEQFDNIAKHFFELGLKTKRE